MARHEESRTRSRSRSPYHASHHHSHRERSASHHHHHRSKSSLRHSPTSKRRRSPPTKDQNADTSSYIPSSAVPPRPVVLPSRATPLSKHDLKTYKPIFASYLDIQKNLDIHDLDEREIRGRWKGFVGRWNRGELAAGWYDPETLAKATATAREVEAENARAPLPAAPSQARDAGGVQSEEDSEEDLGPSLPPQQRERAGPGPAIPTSADLALRDEMIQEATVDSVAMLRAERKADKTMQKERLEELVPRAEAGTRERQLEKRREAAVGNRTFADAKGGGDGVEEVAEDVAMGGGDGGIKEMKAREERKKNEREIKREEILRARQQEREERMVGLRQREEKTMEMLKALAKERFG